MLRLPRIRPACRLVRTELIQVLPRGFATEVQSSSSDSDKGRSPASSPWDATAEQLRNLIPLPRSSISPTTDLSPLSSTSSGGTNIARFPHNVRTAITIRTLMAANLHLGHARQTWNQNMLPYIYGERQGIHIINLEHTLVMLRRAINVTREVALRGGNIVFVGTRPAIHRITVEAAKRADAYFVTSWVGGTITNKERVLRRSVGYDPDKVAQALVPQDEPSAARNGREVKQEALSDVESDSNFARRKNLQPYVHTPDLLVVLDYANNGWAVREANQANIPIIAICDTDCNPRRVQYPIPANDDSLTGIELIAGALSLASREGRDRRVKEMIEEEKRGASRARQTAEQERRNARAQFQQY
ncbi:hypothetical protein PhCBS80983_g00027 [Powellomyces hirtus]|uniref:Ribosomal protein S2 n=1 Tax=Powellomyces hirtus TaxID=109895 RepID=A0A507EF68_9FUNG|nr:hypothetical protein PhCBS80983_g00027 [Powellomyces hirtus]